ncbi:uncharacterized protein LOC121734192 [Aricia agestis]|uniref:uncharacterized protein LOC121734192 n=1 Tax=Aricia agestis TaxID=91739 RepID=UPI001C207C87|nr:uncharacterized protein LOC121734192 [Aricia agestis]
MDNIGENVFEKDTTTGLTETENTGLEDVEAKPADVSQTLFPDSPVYEPDEEFRPDNVEIPKSDTQEQDSKDDEPTLHAKRKLSEETVENVAKMLKLDELPVSSQTLDEEVSNITSLVKRKLDELPSTSRLRTPTRSSPRKITKRSNSVEVTPKTPKTPKSRSASVDISKTRKTPRKVPIELSKNEPIAEEPVEIKSDSAKSNGDVEEKFADIAEKNIDDSALNDSQNFHLVLSPSPEDEDAPKTNYSSEPTLVQDRVDTIEVDKIEKSKSDGYNFSDTSFPNLKDKGRTTDQESTDSVASVGLESPEHMPNVAAKLISKLSNGNSSTPTEIDSKIENITPDTAKLNQNKGKKGKNDLFRNSNATTPSTISPLQNGHSLPISTPQLPVFDIHVSQGDDCEFLSLYVVRTDNDVGADICKEYQRISKRFTIDPYMADVSVNNSPSSVTSVGMVNLPNRVSFASTVSSSSTSSNRTSDGNFVVPQPPRKSVANPSTSVKGYDALMKKLQDIFSHIRDTSVDEINRSLEDKVSVGVQASITGDSMSNGNASPEEVSKCDKATPKSSLKKSRVRGRRPMAGKTKRALLPTQEEEPEYIQGMNSPEMVPTNGDSGNKSPKEEKPIIGTPKSVSKLKQKKRPISPRPATPVEKAAVKMEYPGYPPDTVVLAKWVDKRYYSGKVLEITEPNKYLIKFDDGHSKALLDEFIIFGDLKKLPLQGQSVYAMVDEEQNYEPGLVLEIDENDSGTVTYKCTTDGDTIVMVTASELYLTEDQARSLREWARAKSPATPTTPRRRHLRELDLDNIIQGPRSARSRDKGTSSAKKRVASPKSPKASTSGVKTKSVPVGRKRLASESSEMSESSNSAPPARLEEVGGVEPELQRTPRKVDGVRAGPLQLKGAAKQNVGKKNSKLAKFENDEDTVSMLGPIPNPESKIFTGMHFLLTCNDSPKPKDNNDDKFQGDNRQYSSEDDSEVSALGTDTEDLVFCARPFNKERLREQLESGGGIVHSHFDDVPRNKYTACKLVAPRPCLTAKYILCLAADVRAVSHAWVIAACAARALPDADAHALPAGWSLLQRRFSPWTQPSGKRNTSIFKDKVILLCGDQDFVKFWDRVCTLAGASTRVVNEEDLNMSSAYVLVTDWECPHEVQNKANEDRIPLVSTTWINQCLIDGKLIAPTSHERFSFMYTEPE